LLLLFLAAVVFGKLRSFDEKQANRVRALRLIGLLLPSHIWF
jgi:hypothetical protein